jgi:hypothetical protein
MAQASLLKKASEGFVLKGHDFSRAAKLININAGFSPRGMFFIPNRPRNHIFQQALKRRVWP